MFYAVHYFMGLTESFVHGSRESFPATSELETWVGDLECDPALNCAALTSTQVQHIQTMGVKSHLLWCSPGTALPPNIKGKCWSTFVEPSCRMWSVVQHGWPWQWHSCWANTQQKRAAPIFLLLREKSQGVFPSQQPSNSKDAVWLKVQPKDFTPNLYSENIWKKSPSVSVKLRKYSFHKLLVFSQFYSKSRY